MKTAVMTDTNSGIMKAEADSMGIFLIPMPVIIDDETCLLYTSPSPRDRG